MPKKACCCEGGNWIAIPCRYWGSWWFSGYNRGFTGLEQNQSFASIKNFLQTNPALGNSGPFAGQHPYFPFLNSTLDFTSVPLKIKGISCSNQLPGGAFGGNAGGFGGCIQEKCFETEIDTERNVLYKAWGAGGGGKNKTLPGGNGAYSQKIGTYNNNYIACVGFGGLGFNEGKNFTGWTGAIDTVPGGGGQGYGAWGGGAAYISDNVLQPQNSFLIAAGGGGAGANISSGGHGGVTVGNRSIGLNSGYGGDQTVGGSAGGSGAQSGQISKGGRGAFDLFNGGGGGGGGLRGGGGGGTGHGGGGGSSTITNLSRSGTNNGPPNMCDPMYWSTNISSIGGNQTIPGVGSNVPSNIFSVGYPGKIAYQFAAYRCPCDSSLEEIPEKTYICLTNDQAEYICSQLNNCCGPTGACGASNNSGLCGACGNCGACGSCGSTSAYPCIFGIVGLNDIIPARGTTGAPNQGTTAPANNFPPGGGSGGLWYGAFNCNGVSGSCASGVCGFNLPNETPTGEVAEIKYRTFKYDGELYYLHYQCGVVCDSEYMIPEDAVFSDFGCRPYADCCKGFYAIPICKRDDNPTPKINCWTTNHCPCNPVEVCPEPFIACDDQENYPDIFYTLKEDWYFLVWKTSLWEPFGEQFYKRGSIGPVILENPCSSCSNPFGDGPDPTNNCDNSDNSGSNPNNNTGGQDNPSNCCVEVRDQWDGVSPWKAEVSVSISYSGHLPYDFDCNEVSTCDCDFNGSYTDSDSYTVNLTNLGSLSYFEVRPKGPCPIPCAGGQEEGFSEFTYLLGIPSLGDYFNTSLFASGGAGSGYVEQCYASEQNSCITLGFPSLPSDIGPTTLRDPGYKIVVECVVEDPECIDASNSQPEAYIPQYREIGDGNFPICGISDTGEADSLGPRVYAAGCRLDTYVEKLNEYSGGKYTAVRLSAPNSYWIGDFRDSERQIPGDRFTEAEYITTFRTEGNKVIKRVEYIVYFSSLSFPIFVSYVGKPLPNCCSAKPSMVWGQSGCGLAKPAAYGCDPDTGSCSSDGQDRAVVITYRTLQQCEDNPSIQMLNPRFLTPFGNCPQQCDDFEGSQICTVTLIR